MNREHGDSPLAAGVDGGRMFWTQAADPLLMASLFPNLRAGIEGGLTGPFSQQSPGPRGHSISFTCLSLDTLVFLQELGGCPWPGPHLSALLLPQDSHKHHHAEKPHLIPKTTSGPPSMGCQGSMGPHPRCQTM